MLRAGKVADALRLGHGAEQVVEAGLKPVIVAVHATPERALQNTLQRFEELGRGFTLIALDAQPHDVAAIEKSSASLGVPLKVVADGYDGGREAYGCRMILVRPDQFIAWTGDAGPDDADALMRKVAGQG